MRAADNLRTAAWAFKARPARMGALCVALACTLISVSTLASVVAGYSRQIEEYTFGDLARRISIQENTFLLDRFGPPRIEHLRALQKRVPELAGASAWRSTRVTVKHAKTEISLPLLGVYSETGAGLATLIVAQGRSFSTEELGEAYRGERRICVLGAFARRQLCKENLACGIDSIRVNGVQCAVIGVLQAPHGLAEQSLSDAVITPFFSAARLFERDSEIDVRGAERLELTVREATKTDAVRERVAQEMRALYGSPLSAPPPFQFANDASSLELLANQRTAFAGLLLVVITAAGVGGFVSFAGIMAGMVNERRREIALRSAFGARASDIVWQVLTEAALLALSAALVAALVTTGIVLLLDRFGSAPVALDGTVLALTSVLAVIISLTAAYPVARSAIERRGGLLSG